MNDREQLLGQFLTESVVALGAVGGVLRMHDASGVRIVQRVGITDCKPELVLGLDAGAETTADLALGPRDGGYYNRDELSELNEIAALLLARLAALVPSVSLVAQQRLAEVRLIGTRDVAMPRGGEGALPGATDEP